MAKDWIPVMSYGEVTEITVPSLTPANREYVFQELLVYSGLDQFTAVGEPDTDPDSMTVQRVVGQYNVGCSILATGESNAWLTIRQRMTTCLVQDDLFPRFYEDSLLDPQEANALFMSERSFRLENLESNMDLFMPMSWSSWDVRSKRKLQGGMGIGMLTSVSAWMDGTYNSPAYQLDVTLTLQPFLRAYVTHSG